MTTENTKTFSSAEEAMQFAFETAVRGLASQDWKRCSVSNVGGEGSLCVWNLGRPGLHCAIGWLIPWENQCSVAEKDQNMSSVGRVVGLIPELQVWTQHAVFQEFLKLMQIDHDISHGGGDMKWRFRVLGENFKLVWPSDVPVPAFD